LKKYKRLSKLQICGKSIYNQISIATNDDFSGVFKCLLRSLLP